MASAAPTFHSTKETTNYARLCRLLVDVGASVLRETFDKKRPPGSLDTVLSTPPTHTILQSLRKKRVLNPLQWGKLYPAVKSSVSSKNFDITLLMVLLRNICGLVPPATGWDSLPSVTDTTLEADIVRIKFYRNTVYGHVSEASVDDATFSQYWKDIQNALVRLGGACYQVAVDDLKNECMDPDFEKHYQELLKKWVKDEISIKEKLDEIEEKFGKKLDDLKELIVIPESKTTDEGVTLSRYTSALKASIKSQTELQTKLMASPTISSVKTDEIFTNLLIQHGRKNVDSLDMGRKNRLRQYGEVSESHRVKHCQDIFIPTTGGNQNPKSVLVTGKAGIGKTLFSQKLIRDWADDKLFEAQIKTEIPDFKFAYLLTFRQLNLLGDGRFSLREILNRSPFLDEHSNIDESLFEYIVNYSEKVLIVLDGYDEFSEQDYIASDLDEQYPNNVQEKMPVAALCAKLIKGKILRDSVVMITSRPDESDNIGGIHFDRYVEITGFSEQQVKEYIGKYFKENENMKNTVLDHITKNKNLVSFAHIPVLCFLMCSYMEYILKKEVPSTDALPVKTSELYFEVVNRFVQDHNKKEIPSDVTIDKLSELAAQLLQEKRFLFVKEDMKKFSLQEIESLRASGLLHCGPPFRKSFSQVTKYFCFTHLTIHEYLASRWFVKKRKIPSRLKVSTMVMQFMAGILSKETDTDKFMKELLEQFPSSLNILLTAKCLFEYQDKEFAKNIIKNRQRQYFDHERQIKFSRLTDVDCVAASFLLDVISALNEEEANTKYRAFCEQPFTVKRLIINYRPFTSLKDLSQSGLRRICDSLEKNFCAITELCLPFCGLNYECADCIRELVSSRLTELILKHNQITDVGVASLSEALKSSTCKVTKLNMGYNQITVAGVASLCQALKSSTCQVTSLDLSGNEISDDGVFCLCHVLQSSTCQVTELYLNDDRITDAGVVSLCQAFQSSTCQITTLGLDCNRITDAGVHSLSQALQSSTCQVSTLGLDCNRITDAGVFYLCQALESPTCQVTTLGLVQNPFTDFGLSLLCEALQSSTCQVTSLDLGQNQITDDGVFIVCQALQSTTCHLTTLALDDNEIGNTGFAILYEALQSLACRVTTLHLNGNHINDADVVSLCQALQSSTCQVTSLSLVQNQITDEGVVNLCQALQSPTCKVTRLNLFGNQMTNTGMKCLEDLKHTKPDLELIY
ncbi:hypothetical protein ACROYT_G038154 [Oculina patagonica]